MQESAICKEKQESAFAFLDYSDDIITLKDLDFKYIYCNKPFLKALNCSDFSSVLNKAVCDVLPSNIAEILKKHFYSVLRTKGNKSFVFEVLQKDELIVYKHTMSAVLKNGELSKILSVTRNVTEEAKIKKQLLLKNSHFNSLLNELPFVVYLQDENRNYITGSKNAKDFLNNGVDSYLSGSRIDIEKFEKDSFSDDRHVYEQKKSVTGLKNVTDNNGELHWYEVSKSPVLDERKNFKGILTIARNVDKEKRLDFQKEQFVATLCHDLKNPLLAQLKSFEYLEKETYGKLNDTQKEIISMVIDSAKYMKELLFSLLRIYKYDNGSINLECRNFGVENFMKSCINDYSVLAQEKQVKFDLDVDLNEDEKEVFADFVQLRRVVSNIISNGVNYAYDGTTFGIRVAKAHRHVVFDFKTFSPPIPDELKKHLFGRYVSGSQKYQKVGFGLGLYLSQKVIEAHGGRIYHHTNGAQNIFSFELPCKIKETQNGCVCF